VLPELSARERGRRKRRLLIVFAALMPAVLAGCGGTQNGQNALDAQSHPAKDIASLFWWMMGGAWIGLGLVTALLVLAWARRRKRGVPGDEEGPHPGDRLGWTIVIGLGVVLPIAVVTALFVVSDFFVMETTAAPSPAATKLTVDVIGHQWYWAFRYPGTDAVTADELHIPVRTPINLVATTADVIHSFWVPELNRKIDTIPGQKNRILLYADRPGIYRGQCAEFCGLQHAHMAMLVYAESPSRFRAWLHHEAASARPPATQLERQGERVFMDGPCASCHTIRGTSASGYVGPDLTHLASRATLAGVTIPNRPGYLARWVVDSQHFKPGNEMPDIPLSGPRLRALLAYLESLK
jgi:cytochrome c oxidase subunit 2